MNTDSRDERLKRIRQRSGTTWVGLMQEDIDFLLSLLDSQAAGEYDIRVMNQIRERAADGYERASGGSEIKAGNLMLNDLHYVLSSHNGQYRRGATRMRDKCVAILKRWCKCGPRIRCSFCNVRKEVESLTLDQGEQK